MMVAHEVGFGEGSGADGLVLDGVKIQVPSVCTLFRIANSYSGFVL